MVCSAAEQLAKAENENFNQHNDARARVNIKKMREVAKAKVVPITVTSHAMFRSSVFMRLNA